LHSDILNEGAELIGFAYKISFAVNFDEDTDASTSVNIRFNDTFSSDTIALYGCCGKTFLTEKLSGFR
jgi:hypothetical protein